jgi:hypothetical protein
MRRVVVAAAALLAACGSKTDPGTGTQTLTALVDITATAERTVVEVDLSAGRNPIATAEVTLEDVDRGNEAAAEARAPGSFRAGFNGYARTIRIRLTTPDGDRLEAQLEGPAPHVITRPTEGARVRRGDFETMKVTWDADAPAEAVAVAAADGAPLSLDHDPGEAELPLAPLLDGPQTLEVVRETSVPLDGGLPGSKMRSRYAVDISFTLEG